MADGVSAHVQAVGRAFDRSYSRGAPCFGRAPTGALVRLLAREGVPAGGSALDLGAGYGRNSLYLARQGFGVTAVDASGAGLRRLKRLAELAGLNVRAVRADIREFELLPESYDLIVAITVLGFLDAEELRQLAPRLVRSLRPGGVLLTEEFTRQDPGFAGTPEASEFAGLVRHFFTAEQVPAMFDGLAVLECDEFRTTDGRHGHRHRHAMVRYVGRKKR